MGDEIYKMKKKKAKILLAALLLAVGETAFADGKAVSGIRQINPTTVEITYSDGGVMTVDFYGQNVFRLFRDPKGGIVRDPASNPPARILLNNPRKNAGRLSVNETDADVAVATAEVRVRFDRNTGLMTVTDLRNGKEVIKEVKGVDFQKNRTTVTLANAAGEYFYGGGVQNGRFSHRGKRIEIVNTNSWTDGGVASPAPFYWSTGGYAAMPYTFAPGAYDFGSTDKNTVTISHDMPYLDLFLMVDTTPVSLLQDYYQLTGNPVLLPKFAFYEGHLNAYNRDYWKETTEEGKGILFEDGKRYVESQKDNGGIKESLNGEKQNYQFSARAVIDRYKKDDMPLGWILPNDGYGAGYGQTSTLDGNIDNLKSLGDYARKNGVEIGLWTQSNLHPVDSIPALLQRDIVKEVRDAGVRVLKTDVAWVGAGYSFGLNGIADVANIMPYYGSDARPFIITLDGWAGTQRYGGVWSGDQTGGEWEYIRFHIPTYIGSGLSGMGNITSDMDGIFGGKNLSVNIRDFQWKTFTPMQLNMDGWGSNPKYPQALGEPATSINRSYLKLKSMLLPYTYSCAHEAVTGKPLMRAMFLDDSNDYTHSSATRYQYMYGPSFLVAPIYQNTAADKEGNDVRNGIYLPKGTWYDYFTGATYEGGCVLNDYFAPIWKLPVLVKSGAIIPMVNPNNNPSEIDKNRRVFELYPDGKTEFTLYDDDGTTQKYLANEKATTRITSDLNDKQVLTVGIDKTEGTFDGMVKNQSTTFYLNTNAKPKKLTVVIGGKKIRLSEAEQGDNTWQYVQASNINRFSTANSEMERLLVTKNAQIIVRLASCDITKEAVELRVEGFARLNKSNETLRKKGALTAPELLEADIQSYSVTPKWKSVQNADYYEIAFKGQTYTTIRHNSLLFDDLQPATDYDFKVRAVNSEGASEWTPLHVKTAVNPLEYAIQGLTATSTARDMEGFEINRLVDFSTTGDIWHTYYYTKAVPFDFTVDLHSTNTLDKLQYVPRANGGNGTITKCDIAVSKDGRNWTEIGPQQWARDGRTKEVTLSTHPVARYVKVSVKEAVGNFGSGREFYVFKVPGTKTILPGDINLDGKVDENDFTSYMNYTGLKKGDADFDGYISGGDINGNGLIDAYDISNVAMHLEDGWSDDDVAPVGGKVYYEYNRKSYAAGDDVIIKVKGKDLQSVNAFNLIFPYSPKELQFVKVETDPSMVMRNLTYDRHHSDGSQVLYPTFVNVGDHHTFNGDADLFVIRMKALKPFTVKNTTAKGLLVDKQLREVEL